MNRKIGNPVLIGVGLAFGLAAWIVSEKHPKQEESVPAESRRPVQEKASEDWKNALALRERGGDRITETSELGKYLSDSDLIETAFLALTEDKPGTEDPGHRESASRYLAEALSWHENPARKLLLIEIEALALRDLRQELKRGGSVRSMSPRPSRVVLFRALKTHAPDEITRLREQNPESILVAYLNPS